MQAIPLLLPLAMLALLIFSQRKRALQCRATQASLAPGDRVMTTAGICGLVAVAPRWRAPALRSASGPPAAGACARSLLAPLDPSRSALVAELAGESRS